MIDNRWLGWHGHGTCLPMPCALATRKPNRKVATLAVPGILGKANDVDTKVHRRPVGNYSVACGPVTAIPCRRNRATIV